MAPVREHHQIILMGTKDYIVVKMCFVKADNYK